MGLIEHTKNEHGHCKGVCPICCQEEFGDPNYVSPDLLGHMHLRHRCNYEELIDRNLDEEAMFAKILEQSKNDF